MSRSRSSRDGNEEEESAELDQEKGKMRRFFAVLKKGTKMPREFLYSITHLPPSVQEYFDDTTRNPDFYEKCANIILKQTSTVEGTVWPLALFVLFLVALVLLLIAIGVYGVIGKKNAWLDWFYLKTQHAPPIPQEIIDKSQSMNASILDMVTETSKEVADGIRDVSIKSLFKILDLAGVGGIVKTVFMLTFVQITGRLIYYKFGKDDGKKLQTFLSGIEYFMLVVSLALILNVYAIDRDWAQQRTVVAGMAFLIWVFSSELMARKIFSWIIGYLVRPDSDTAVKAYKILQSKDWARSKEQSEAFMRMKEELEKACMEFTEGYGLRSKTHAETVIKPKPCAGQQPNKRIFTSLAGLQMEGGGIIQTMVFRLTQIVSQVFGMGGVEGLRPPNKKQHKGAELNALRKDQQMRSLSIQEQKELENSDTEEIKFN